jgi:receptor protein-tyrosine kinase
MNRTDPIGATVDSNPVLLARLQATLPGSALGRGLGEDASTSSYRDPLSSTRPQAKKDTGWFRPACEAVAQHAWLIVTLAILALALGYLYTVHLSVPLYRVRASIEVRNAKSGAHIEALAHILESQSLTNAVLATMSDKERTSLIERTRVPFLGPQDSDEAFRQRLEATAIPSAQVIDISFISPGRTAAVHFVNGLIDALIRREQQQKTASAFVPPALPDDWNNQPDRIAEQIAIIDPAIPGLDPVGPNLSDNLLISALCGIFLGIAIALIRKFAVNTFSGPGSVGDVLGVRELGAIPERKLLGPAGSDTAHAGVQMDPNDESLRYLRSSLLYHPGKQPIRFLAFTSAAPGEGKTTVVANLSMSLAATGRRVLVIDGDLRRPRLHRLLQVPSGPGLADLLRRDPSAPPASLYRYVNSTSFQNLYVLPPGTAGNDAPELLAGPHLAQLFRELAKSFDFVLIDTPPLLACSDARNYARAVEGVVLVVRSSETQKRAALVARDMLLQDGAIIVGTVLTGWRQNYPAYNYPTAPTYIKT